MCSIFCAALRSSSFGEWARGQIFSLDADVINAHVILICAATYAAVAGALAFRLNFGVAIQNKFSVVFQVRAN